MKFLIYTERFRRSYESAPLRAQRALDKKIVLLARNLRHPSLHAKKYDRTRWQARVTKDWRFYFRIEKDAYILLDIIPHPK